MTGPSFVHPDLAAAPDGRLPAAEELAHITPDLRPLAVHIERVRLDPENARTGHDVSRLAGLLRQYGQRKPIVINRQQENKVEAGNGTYKAARQLGWGWIAAACVDDDPMTAVGFAISDNRSAEWSQWDYPALVRQLEAVAAEEVETGFSEDEAASIAKLIGNIPTWEEMEAGYSNVDERDLWPLLRLKIPPGTMALYEELLGEIPGDDEAVKFGVLLRAVDRKRLLGGSHE